MLSEKNVLSSLILFVLCLSLTFPVSGQAATATLNGMILDEKGAVVVRARISLVNVSTSLQREATTNDSGYFNVPLLPPGNYRLSAMGDGFCPLEIRDIVLHASDQRSLNIRLTPGPSIASDAPVPDFEFMDFNGKPRKFSEFFGHVVLIDFWATWCKPCLADIPHLKELYAKYRDQGFEIIGMDSETFGQDAEDNDPVFAKERDVRARQIVSTRGASWTHATAATAVPLAEKVFGVKTLPTKILIDAHGKIVARVEEGAELDAWLEKLLGGKP
jgi:thiol-disulfide isomerase/thioredoxin